MGGAVERQVHWGGPWGSRTAAGFPLPPDHACGFPMRAARGSREESLQSHGRAQAVGGEVATGCCRHSPRRPLGRRGPHNPLLGRVGGRGYRGSQAPAVLRVPGSLDPTLGGLREGPVAVPAFRKDFSRNSGSETTPVSLSYELTLRLSLSPCPWPGASGGGRMLGRFCGWCHGVHAQTSRGCGPVTA